MHSVAADLVNHLLLLPLDSVAPTLLPEAAPKLPVPGLEKKFTDALSFVKWIALAICVFCLVLAGVRIAMSGRRGDGAEHASSIGAVLIGVFIVSFAATIISFFMS